MKIEPHLLHGTTFVESWLRREDRATDFLASEAHRLEGYRERIDAVDRAFEEDDRRAVAREFTGGGRGAPDRLAAFVRDGGLVVTTGQQPGLFGGPLYALYKGLTAAALASRLEAGLGRPVIPVFWIASEHHVWDDLRTGHVIDPANELQDISLAPRTHLPSLPAHRIVLGGEIREAVDRFVSSLPETEFRAGWSRLLTESHLPGASLVEAFRLVLEDLLGRAGVFLVRADAPGLKTRSLPLLLRELSESGDRHEELARVAAGLRGEGFEPQVPVLEGATNVFLEGPQGRERLFRESSGFRMRGSEVRLTFREVEGRVADDPSLISPNVLLRPVVEAALLPTLAYVGGPGEIAYLPQTAPVFLGHGIERPVVHPRVGLMVVERKVEKILKKFDLPLVELALPHHQLAGRIAREEMPIGTRSALSGLREALGSAGEELRRAVAEIDPTLRGAVESFEGQTRGLLEELERKVIQGVKREHDIALAQLAKAQINLYPLGRPQERVLNPFQFLVRYDTTFLDLVRTRANEAVLL